MTREKQPNTHECLNLKYTDKKTKIFFLFEMTGKDSYKKILVLVKVWTLT